MSSIALHQDPNQTPSDPVQVQARAEPSQSPSMSESTRRRWALLDVHFDAVKPRPLVSLEKAAAIHAKVAEEQGNTPPPFNLVPPEATPEALSGDLYWAIQFEDIDLMRETSKALIDQSSFLGLFPYPHLPRTFAIPVLRTDYSTTASMHVKHVVKLALFISRFAPYESVVHRLRYFRPADSQSGAIDFYFADPMPAQQDMETYGAESFIHSIIIDAIIGRYTYRGPKSVQLLLKVILGVIATPIAAVRMSEVYMRSLYEYALNWLHPIISQAPGATFWNLLKLYAATGSAIFDRYREKLRTPLVPVASVSLIKVAPFAVRAYKGQYHHLSVDYQATADDRRLPEIYEYQDNTLLAAKSPLNELAVDQQERHRVEMAMRNYTDLDEALRVTGADIPLAEAFAEFKRNPKLGTLSALSHGITWGDIYKFIARYPRTPLSRFKRRNQPEAPFPLIKPNEFADPSKSDNFFLQTAMEIHLNNEAVRLPGDDTYDQVSYELPEKLTIIVPPNAPSRLVQLLQTDPMWYECYPALKQAVERARVKEEASFKAQARQRVDKATQRLRPIGHRGALIAKTTIIPVADNPAPPTMLAPDTPYSETTTAVVCASPVQPAEKPTVSSFGGRKTVPTQTDPRQPGPLSIPKARLQRLADSVTKATKKGRKSQAPASAQVPTPSLPRPVITDATIRYEEMPAQYTCGIGQASVITPEEEAAALAALQQPAPMSVHIAKPRRKAAPKLTLRLNKIPRDLVPQALMQRSARTAGGYQYVPTQSYISELLKRSDPPPAPGPAPLFPSASDTQAARQAITYYAEHMGRDYPKGVRVLFNARTPVFPFLKQDALEVRSGVPVIIGGVHLDEDQVANILQRMLATGDDVNITRVRHAVVADDPLTVLTFEVKSRYTTALPLAWINDAYKPKWSPPKMVKSFVDGVLAEAYDSARSSGQAGVAAELYHYLEVITTYRATTGSVYGSIKRYLEAEAQSQVVAPYWRGVKDAPLPPDIIEALELSPKRHWLFAAAEMATFFRSYSDPTPANSDSSMGSLLNNRKSNALNVQVAMADFTRYLLEPVSDGKSQFDLDYSQLTELIKKSGPSWIDAFIKGPKGGPPPQLQDNRLAAFLIVEAKPKIEVYQYSNVLNKSRFIFAPNAYFMNPLNEVFHGSYKIETPSRPFFADSWLGADPVTLLANIVREGMGDGAPAAPQYAAYSDNIYAYEAGVLYSFDGRKNEASCSAIAARQMIDHYSSDAFWRGASVQDGQPETCHVFIEGYNLQLLSEDLRRSSEITLPYSGATFKQFGVANKTVINTPHYSYQYVSRRSLYDVRGERDYRRYLYGLPFTSLESFDHGATLELQFTLQLPRSTFDTHMRRTRQLLGLMPYLHSIGYALNGTAAMKLDFMPSGLPYTAVLNTIVSLTAIKELQRNNIKPSHLRSLIVSSGTGRYLVGPAEWTFEAALNFNDLRDPSKTYLVADVLGMNLKRDGDAWYAVLRERSLFPMLAWYKHPAHALPAWLTSSVLADVVVANIMQGGFLYQEWLKCLVTLFTVLGVYYPPDQEVVTQYLAGSPEGRGIKWGGLLAHAARHCFVVGFKDGELITSSTPFSTPNESVWEAWVQAAAQLAASSTQLYARLLERGPPRAPRDVEIVAKDLTAMDPIVSSRYFTWLQSQPMGPAAGSAIVAYAEGHPQVIPPAVTRYWKDENRLAPSRLARGLFTGL